MSETSAQIRTAFGKVGLKSLSNDIVSKCVGLLSQVHMTPDQLAEIWEAHSLNKNVSELNDHTFHAFRTVAMKDSLQEGAVKSNPLISKRTGLPMVTPPSKRLQGAFPTPASAVDQVASRVSLSPNKVTPAGAGATQLPSYNERKDVGKVMVSFNPQKLEPGETTPAKTLRCEIKTDFPTNVSKSYRHMFTPLEEKARKLDEHLVTMGEEIVEKYSIGKDEGIAELEAVGVPRQDKVCCIGRICNEAHTGRINQTSVLLEGSNHFSNGTRVHVDLSEMKSSKSSFSLFPGQIVAVEGMNVSGRKMVASRICEGAAHSPEKTSVAELIRLHHTVQDGQPLRLLSVCGPYTTSDNLDFEPFVDLFNIIREQKPDVVILAGPFVDMRHSQVERGETFVELEDGTKMPVTYEAFFANKVAALIEEFFDNDEDAQVQFVLVPSLDDAAAEWVYPQAPFEDRIPNGGKELRLPNAEGIEVGSLGLDYVETAGRPEGGPQRVIRASNPCTLKINELIVGVTATDAIFHISADEANANLEPGSRLSRIAQHLVQQRSYYPLFPPATGTNLDLKHMDQWKMPCQPDLLIVPSKLTCFARTVLDSTVVVNPGHLSRGTTGGSYAIMDVNPIKRETLENAGGDDVQMTHSLQDRIRLEIKRI